MSIVHRLGKNDFFVVKRKTKTKYDICDTYSKTQLNLNYSMHPRIIFRK